MKVVEDLVREKAETIETGEACIVAENYTVRFRKIMSREYDGWVKESGENNPYKYAEAIVEEMQTKWSKKEGGWDIDSRWIDGNNPEWYDRTSEVFYAVYKKVAGLHSIKAGRHVVEGRIFLNYKGVRVHELSVDGKEVELGTSLAYDSHSPDGFDWGYVTSGSSQSALAILLEILPSDVAIFNHTRFMKETVAHSPLEGKNFEMVLSVRKDADPNTCTIHYDINGGEFAGDFNVDLPRT